MPHLPQAGAHEDEDLWFLNNLNPFLNWKCKAHALFEYLDGGPPKHFCIGRFGRLSKSLLSKSLEILLLLNLLHLVEQLADAQLQFGQFLAVCYFFVSFAIFPNLSKKHRWNILLLNRQIKRWGYSSNLQVEMNSQFSAGPGPIRRVRHQTDFVFAGKMRREGELPITINP